MPFKKNAKRSAAASNREAAKKGRGDRPAEAAAPDGENAANAKVGCGGSVSSADDERANGQRWQGERFDGAQEGEVEGADGSSATRGRRAQSRGGGERV